MAPPLNQIVVVAGVRITIVNGVASWTAGLAIDANGAPNCAHPDDKSGIRGLDYVTDAGRPGAWWGVVTDTGDETGTPIIQGPDDPCPGFMVSTTALQDPSQPTSSPRRYVDATKVPYISVPPQLRDAGCRLGDVARVSYRGQWCDAIVADVGPRHAIGEGSPYLARQLGIGPSPRDGGVAHGVSVQLWLGSALSRPWPRAVGSFTPQVWTLMARDPMVPVSS